MEQVMLDMIPTGAKAVCHVSQYDIGRTIRFNLRSGGTAYTLAGTETIKVYIKKPDGTTAERNIANTSSTYVDWVTGEGDCDQAGKCECELVITSGTTVIGSKNFTVKIEEDPYNEQGVVTETAGPAVIATFTTNVVDLLQEVKCSINPIQNGTPWIDSNEVNKEPYIKRAVAGTASRIGNHLYDKLVGGSFTFNQLAQISDVSASQTASGLTITNNSDGSITVTGTATDNKWVRITNYFRVATNHKYLIDINENNTLKISDGFASSHGIIDFQQSGLGLYIRPSANATYNETLYIVIIDLTAMFGSTIADYIYGLEQATAGAGVAWFKALFPNDYYAYNAGELMSVKATAHVMKNASNQVIGNYALDSNLVLNGLFKLDVNNKLYADGDTYESSGLVTRKYKPYTITSSTQMISQTDLTTVTRYVFITDNEEPVISGGGVICVGLVKDNSYSGDYPHIYIDNTAQNKGRVYVFLPIGQAIGTINLIYELATPTTEQASPFTNPQVCDENGTEEYTDNRAVAIPVGHETYQANICEITGFDELNVGQSGINLWDEQWEQGTFNWTTGEKLPSTNRIRSKNKIKVTPNTEYFISSDNAIEILYYRADGSYIKNVNRNNQVFTTPEDCEWMNINDTTTATYGNNISINRPSSDHDYHSYSGKLIKLEFDDTVYLAEASCLNGVWKLKLLGAEVDLGDLSWYPGACALENKYTMRSDGIANLVLAPPSSSVIVDILCPIYPTIIGDSTYLGNTGISILRGGTLAVFDDRYSTIDSANAFKSAMSGVKLVYPLATPTEITLDETEQFEALLGVNNVWHDGNGDTEVKYLYNA